jgi:hypothetical protein
MRVGDTFRYGRPKDPVPESVDGIPNFWHVTHTPEAARAQLEHGINKIQEVRSPGGQRVPAILLGSSTHKVGSATTPWQDTIDPDIGYALYYGDSTAKDADAPATLGNRSLLDAFRRHDSPDRAERLRAEPLVVFRRERKGFVEFAGFGIIERVRLVTQIDPLSRKPFANYAFELLLFDLSKEGEEFAWDWISARRSKDVTDQECFALAPASWRLWVNEGVAARSRIRRSVAKLSIVSREEQLPDVGSREGLVLEEIRSFYAKPRNHRFEAVAERIAASVLGSEAGNYHLGWITRRGHDFGIDFVGRLDIGDGFARTSMIVLGQAKCEQDVTSARDIARTVARLQRGWFGCYVTTSWFSDGVQQEVIEDKYPIALINGRRVAEEFRKLAFASGYSTRELLEEIDESYDERLAQRRPEEVLLI